MTVHERAIAIVRCDGWRSKNPTRTADSESTRTDTQLSTHSRVHNSAAHSHMACGNAALQQLRRIATARPPLRAPLRARPPLLAPATAPRRTLSTGSSGSETPRPRPGSEERADRDRAALERHRHRVTLGSGCAYSCSAGAEGGDAPARTKSGRIAGGAPRPADPAPLLELNLLTEPTQHWHFAGGPDLQAPTRSAAQ